MSVSLWRWTESCDGGPCPGDCDLCSKSMEDPEDESNSETEEKADVNVDVQPTLKTGLSVGELVREVHENARKHGFWDDPPEFGTSIALIHSELSEALEEVRAGNRLRPGEKTPPVYYSGGGYVATAPTACAKKPEGYAVELADAVIRIADLCGYLGIDLEEVIREKMEYNATRPYKHGKRF